MSRTRGNDQLTCRKCLLQFHLAVDGVRPDDLRQVAFDFREEILRIRHVARGSF